MHMQKHKHTHTYIYRHKHVRTQLYAHVYRHTYVHSHVHTETQMAIACPIKAHPAEDYWDLQSMKYLLQCCSWFVGETIKQTWITCEKIPCYK